MSRKFLVTLLVFLTVVSPAKAESLRLCTQNLYRVDGAKTDPQELARVKRLAKRISGANCDVVAAQEIAGEDRTATERSAELLRKTLEEVGEKKWQVIVGDSRDRHITNGFFVNKAKANVVSNQSLSRTVLPSLQPRGPVTYFSRGPLRLELAVRGLDQPLILYALHLKSKANGWRDPAKLQYESWRIEMAEGLRRDAALSKGIVVMMGDRNTRHDSAASQVLSGKLRIEDFKEAKCGVNKEPDLRAKCQGVSKRRAQFVPMVERAYKKEIKNGSVGSYKYRGKWEMIDEILVSRKALRYFPEKAVLAGQGDGASDHLLLAVDLEVKE